VGGLTIHSFAKLGLGTDSIEKILERINKDKKSQNRIIKTKILAIDEISMLSAKFFNLLNYIFQMVRKNNAPFGGVTLVLFGDFLQLPPVIKPGEDDDICLKCAAWREAEIETVLLKANHRQKDDINFYNVLQNVRFGENLDEAFQSLKERVGIIPTNKAIKLVSHREQANRINLMNIEKLSFQEKVFIGKFEGKEEYTRSYLPNFKEAMRLVFKKGARVMLNSNVKVDDGLCNGTIGNIVDFAPKTGYPVVLFEGIKFPVIVAPHDFIIEDPITSEVFFKFTQIPLQFAYALTIHKSQGLTFDFVHTDISRCFLEGQAYVSLSRAKNLDGLFLDPFNKNVLKASQRIVKYYKKLDELYYEKSA
jgi:ATP-dependent DNA helicase PIF1